MATLRSELRNQLIGARKHESIAIPRTLPKGLKVEITQKPTGEIELALEREGVYPSDAEWKTILNHWPEPVPANVIFARYKQGKRYRIVGHWPRPLMLEDFPSEGQPQAL